MAELTIDQAIQKGIEAHKAGQVQEADRLYTAILKAQPKHPDANHNMGALAVGVGKVEQALPFLKTALEANPARAQFWLSYIDALIELEQLANANAVLDQARSKGANGDGFDKLEQRLRELNKKYYPDDTFTETLGTNQSSTLDIAIQLRETGEFNQAIDLLKGAINQFPENADMFALLSHCYLLAERVDAAKLYLDKAKKIDPENVLVGWNIARLTLKEKKPLEALNVARDFSQKFPDDIEGMGVLGACLRANKETTESLEVLNRAIVLNPNYAEALVNRGLLRLSKENKPEAVADLEMAHRLKPHIKQIWDLVIGLKVETQEYSDAIVLLLNMITIDPNWEKGFSLLAACNQKADDNALAVKSFKKVLEIKPGSAAMHVNLGIALSNQGETKTAITNFKKALAIKPDCADAYSNMGNALKNQGKLEEAIQAYNKALAIKPDCADTYNNMGNALQDQGELEKAIQAYKKALAIKSDYAEAYNNMGNALQDQGKLEKAIQAYNKALAIKSDYAEVYNNMGNALQDQGKLEKAIQSYNKALAIKPDNAEAYNNMGNALKEQGKLEEAIEAYNKALAIKPDYAEAYNNMGIARQDQGKLEEAIQAYKKALAIKSDYAEAYRHLSIITKYNSDTTQISEVEALLQRTDLSDADRCNFLFTHAKMQEDIGYLSAAVDSYVAGGDLRQKLLAYKFKQDEHLFGRIKKTAPKFKDVALNVTGGPIRHTPIFILGMPRSGTTLVEQIVSSHTKVTGAGELEHVSRFGTKLAIDLTSPTSEAVSVFREHYLAELVKRADGQAFITDKMPQNFQYIALICAAFPEAKIVHVQRNAEATCWSNFKNYFTVKGLGYSYNLRDTVKYFRLYKDLMHFWSQSYSDRIYNLVYDKLTENQEQETRRLIEYLELNWEDACLAPQNNNRSVKTASQQQVRQKVYKGSSQAWRKYEPFLDGVFDGLKS